VSAAVPQSVDIIVVQGGAESQPYGSALTVSMDEPVTRAAAERIADRLVPSGQSKSALAVKGGDVVLTARALSSRTMVAIDQGEAADATPRIGTMAAPAGQTISCSRFYSFSDINGTYTIQRRCGGRTAPWGFTLSPTVRSSVVGLVSERGMDWWRNSVRQGRQAPHVVGAAYLFHGTCNPALASNRISYADLFTWRHNIGPGGSASLVIQGNFVFSSDPSGCSTGGPC
jgi:hypothetical protein